MDTWTVCCVHNCSEAQGAERATGCKLALCSAPVQGALRSAGLCRARTLEPRLCLSPRAEGEVEAGLKTGSDAESAPTTGRGMVFVYRKALPLGRDLVDTSPGQSYRETGWKSVNEPRLLAQSQVQSFWEQNPRD